jgi:transcriptional regulator with XRE-family HTH domain
VGRKEQTATHFGKRVKAERVLRGWSQAQMADLLKAHGIPMIHPTTIAKIESGARPTRIDEATGIADVFGISLDALLGRGGMEDESSHSMTLLGDEAAQLIPDVAQIRERLAVAYRPLQAQFGIAELEGRVSAGDKYNFEGVAAEEQRALLMWWQLQKALIHAADLLDSLGTLAKIRTMGAIELRRFIRATYAVAAVSQRRSGNRAAKA